MTSQEQPERKSDVFKVLLSYKPLEVTLAIQKCQHIDILERIANFGDICKTFADSQIQKLENRAEEER